ncbi:uncharacterized protein DEA37_0012195 [Paragonimus westermani]|uniref:Uncharacterized protein n=1 Tax=Paragonimus westermani TaxID=34504 RepID=A0A5J4NNH8_9TREM|nr:uncharacterized protein DEA37_0012195 [Paragonimus westermani]
MDVPSVDYRDKCPAYYDYYQKVLNRKMTMGDGDSRVFLKFIMLIFRMKLTTFLLGTPMKMRTTLRRLLVYSRPD